MVPGSLGGQQDTQVDLCASRESAHLPVYFSIYRKDKRGINALVQRRKFKKKYAFSPPDSV